MEDSKVQESSNEELKSLLLGKMAEAVTVLTCILDVTGSNLGLDTNNLD
jgi:hypothetical protein